MTTSEMTPADFAAVCGGNNRNNGGGLFGDDASVLLIVLFLFAFLGNGFGNNGAGSLLPLMLANNGGGMGGAGYVAADVQNGFNHAAVIDGINTLTSNVTNGFAQAEISANARQIADMQQNFALQTALTNNLFGIQSALQNCCCDNKVATLDLKGTVISENCADRAALSDGIRDVIESNTRNTQAILDKLCQQEIDAKNDLISNLRSQLAMKDLAASQIQQTATLRAGQEAEVDALYNRLSSCPISTVPVYGRQPIFTCGNNVGGCGCGCGSF